MTLRGQFTKATAFALFMLVLPPEIGLSQQQPSIVISSPAAGHPVAPGATIVVNVVPSAGVSPVAMELFGDPPLGIYSVAVPATFSFTETIPGSIPLGRYEVAATAFLSPGQSIDSDPLVLDVERADMPVQLSVVPGEIHFDQAGAVVPIAAFAVFADQTESEVTQSSMVSYTIADSSVASVDTNGILSASRPGDTLLTVTYAGQNSTLQVTAPVSVFTPIQIGGTDSIPPSTAAVLSPLPNASLWNKSDVTVNLNSVDNPGGSGLKNISYSISGAQATTTNVVPGGAASFTISTEGVSTVTFFGTDNAGNVEAAKSITIRLDKTPPTITATRTPGPNINGWNNVPVAVTFQCKDSLSGLAAGSPPPPTLLSMEGVGQVVSGTCTDVAGNSVSASVQGIKIDLTPPVIIASVNPPPNSNGWNSSPATVSFSAVDSLSGVAVVSAPVIVAVDGAGQVLHGSATDLAGNLASTAVIVNLDQAPPEAFIQFDPGTRDVVLFGRDPLSGVAPGPVSPASIQHLSNRNGEDQDHGHDSDENDRLRHDGDDHRTELRTYQISDLAGNSLVLVMKVRKREHSETVSLVSVQYNGGTGITLSRNEETFEWDIDNDGRVERLHQTFSESDGEQSQKWNANYEPRQNTTVVERESPKPEQRFVVQSLDLLRIATDSGRLMIEH